MKSIEIINPRYFIDNIYEHLDKICKQSKTPLPPRDTETIEKLHKILINNIDDLTNETLNKTRTNIYKEWKKDQKGFLYINKGFHTAFKFALEQSIPRTLEQIGLETPTLHYDHLELLRKTNKHHLKVFHETMIFQKGTAEYIHNYARYIPEEEYLFRSKSSIQKSKILNIPELERWNFLTASIWEYINTNKIDVNKRKYEYLPKYSISNNSIPSMGVMEYIDYFGK